MSRLMVNGLTLALAVPVGQLGTALGDMGMMVLTGEPTHISVRILPVLLVGVLWCYMVKVVMCEPTEVDRVGDEG